MDKQRKQKFDSISAGHEAALISMGIIQAAEKAPEHGPELPAQLAHVMEKYRNLKFVQRRTEGAVVLYPREQLSWQDLAAYNGVTGDSISLLESELIMGLDAIFEGRDDG